MSSFYLILFLFISFIGYGQGGAGEVCRYAVEDIDGFSGEVTIKGEVFIAATVFQIVFLVNSIPITEFRRAVLLNQSLYFTISLNTNQIMATRTVPVGVSDVLVFTIDDTDCMFTLTIIVIDEASSSTVQSTESTKTTPYCHYNVQDIDGFSGEVTIMGELFIASPVFQIVFLVNDIPITESRRAVLLNQPEYFTISLNTNQIMATRTVPVGVSDVLVFTIDDTDCMFTLTVTVVDEASSSTVQSTELTTATSYCHYNVQDIGGFSGEVEIMGEIFIASPVFEIVFLINDIPITEFRRAVLLNEPQYFTITINTNEIMAKRTVPVGTSEKVAFRMADEWECQFVLTVNVISPPTVAISTMTPSTYTTDQKSSTQAVSSTESTILSTSPAQPFPTSMTETGKTFASTLSHFSVKMSPTASPPVNTEASALISPSNTPMSHATSATNDNESTRLAITTTFLKSFSKSKFVSMEPSSTVVAYMEFHCFHSLSFLLGLVSNLTFMYIFFH